MTPPDEQEILKSYEALLAEAQAEVASLSAVINTIRNRIVHRGRAIQPVATQQGHAWPPAAPMRATTRNGRPTLTALIREIMADGRNRDADAVLAVLEKKNAVPDTDNPRQQILNRLSELATEGYLDRVGRGVYKLAPVPAQPELATPEGNPGR